MIGWSARDSTRVKLTSRAAAALKPNCAWRSPQPSEETRMNAYTSEVIPAVPVSAPAASNRPAWRGVSPTKRGSARATAAPIGTLISSDQRQDAHEVSMPPTTRPIEAPMPAMDV